MTGGRKDAEVGRSAGLGDELIGSVSLIGPDMGWLRLVMNSMHEGFGLLAPDFTIIELNKEAVRIDGRPRAELIGHSHWAVYPNTEADEIGRLYKLAMTQRVPVSLNHSYHWPDGRTSWFETRAFPVENGCLAIFYRDVTEQEQANEALRVSERRFKSAVQAMEGILWTNNPDGKMLGEQPGWNALTGQSQAEYQGYGWADAIHPDDAKPTIDAWETALAKRSLFEFEHRVRRYDGVWRLFAVRALPVEDSEGHVVEWVGIHRDISDTRADALRLKQLGESIDAVFYVHELDESRISYVSAAYERIWGRTREELHASLNSFMSAIHPDDLTRVKAAQADQRAGASRTIEYRLLRDDGSVRHILDRPVDAVDPVSGARRVLGLASDITEFREAQDLLRRNSDTFALLVEANPFGVYVVDENLRLLTASQGSEKVFANIDPLIGRDFEEILRILWLEPFASEAIGRFRRTLATGEPYVSPSTVETRADIGETEAYDWRIERISLPSGNHGVVCFFYDLSERIAYEAKLKQALADKDLLAREIDHRVKNNLAVVGSLLAMQRNAATSEETRIALEEAASRVIAVARVHERLHKSDQLGIVSFGDYLEDLCAEVGSYFRRPNVTLACRTIAIDLPAEKALSLGLIANELITNAFKHGCAGGATKILVELSKSHTTLSLEVSDNGAGLKHHDAAKPESMGLKMVRALSRQIKAKMKSPAPGMPSRFSVSMPISPPLGSGH